MDTIVVKFGGSSLADSNQYQKVAAIIRDGDRIFATQRGYGAFKDGWEFPGGKCEEGEKYEACLVREIDEELGVRIEVTRELLKMRYAYPDKVIDFAFLEARIVGGQLQVREHKEIRWLNADEIAENELCPADAEALIKMRESKQI